MRKYIEEKKLIVILRGLTLEQALQTAQSLYHAGVRLVAVSYTHLDVYKRQKVAYCIYLGAMEFEMERQSPAVPPHSAAAAAD